MNQRTKNPGLWSASWCASCASCGWRWSESAVVLMGLLIRYLAWVARLATLALVGAGVGVTAVPAVTGAMAFMLVSAAAGAAAAGVAPGICPPFCATHVANSLGEV